MTLYQAACMMMLDAAEETPERDARQSGERLHAHGVDDAQEPHLEVVDVPACWGRVGDLLRRVRGVLEDEREAGFELTPHGLWGAQAVEAERRALLELQAVEVVVQGLAAFSLCGGELQTGAVRAMTQLRF